MIGKKKKKADMEDNMKKEKADLKKDIVMPEENVESSDAPEQDGDDVNQELDSADVKQRQVDELNDKFLRTLAEFDNYRKRTMKERVELIQSASFEMILALLPVLDDFDRAVLAFENSADIDAIKEGIILVQQKLKGILTQKGLEEMDTMGKDFDTDLHEAIANVPAAKEADINKVMDIVQKGYLLNGKVLRFAKVVVAKDPEGDL